MWIRLGGRSPHKETIEEKTDILLTSHQGIEELSIVDLARMGNEAFVEADKIIFGLAKATEEINTKNINRTAELEHYAEGEPDLSELVLIFDRGVDDLAEYDDKFKEFSPSLFASLNTGFGYYDQLISTLMESGTPPSELHVAAYTKVASTRIGLAGAVENTSAFRDAINSMPLATKNFNANKRAVVQTLDELVDMYKNLRDTAIEVQSSIRLVIKDGE